VDTKYNFQMNNLLTDAHRSCIGVAPFKWCLEMERSLDICTPLIQQMVRRWDSYEQCFHIYQRLVPFGVVYVCMSLDLNVVGEDVEFDAYGCGCVGSLFSCESITIKGITKLISCTIGTKHNDVDNVCRLYILLCFVVLYFSRNSKCVCNIPFRILDNIDILMNYNWGGAVHTFLVNGLSRAHLVNCKQKNQHNITLPNCVVVL